MYLFIAIIFIAELIIALHIIFYVIKADRYVCALNEKVKECRPQIEECLFCVKDSVSCAKSCVEAAINFIKCKRQEFMERIIKTLLIYLLLLLLEKKFKKLSPVVKYVVFAKDYWDSISA